MTYIIDINNEIIRFKYSDRISPYFSEMTFNENGFDIFSGELHKTMNYFLDLEWEERIHTLLIDESFSLIRFKKNKLHIATSKSGLEPVFYYKKEKRFIISDDIWEIISLLDVSLMDIDRENIVEQLNLPFGLFDTTFIKGIKILLPGRYIIYDIKTNEFKNIEYFTYMYKPNTNISLNTAVNKMDNLIRKTMSDIFEECGNVVYGVGLSGGLDSRIIPHYALTKNMNVKSFIFGARKPNNIFLSHDHVNARKLAKIFGIVHSEIEWNVESLEKKILLDIKNYPIGSPQFFKFEHGINADVLLTGGSGLIVGGHSLSKDIPNMDIDALTDKMFDIARSFYPNTLFRRRVSKALSYLFKMDCTLQKHKKFYSKIFNAEIEKSIKNKFRLFIDEKKQEGLTNIDIFEYYFYNVIAARNKFGGFESGIGTMRSFSIYVPRMLGECLNWKKELLVGRPVLKELIKLKIPKVASINEQNYEGNILKENYSIVNKLFNMISFMLHGNGTAMEEKYIKKCKKYFLKDMMNEHSWFYEIVNIKDDLNEIAKHDDNRFLLRLWKTKRIIDVIETKNYNNFIINKPYITIDKK